MNYSGMWGRFRKGVLAPCTPHRQFSQCKGEHNVWLVKAMVEVVNTWRTSKGQCTERRGKDLTRRTTGGHNVHIAKERRSERSVAAYCGPSSM